MTTAKPRLLVISGLWPHFRANREAANVISYLIMLNLARGGAFELAFLCLNQRPVVMPLAGQPDIDDLKALGVHFLPEVTVAPLPRLRHRLGTFLLALLSGQWERLVPGYESTAALTSVLRDWKPDAVLTIWSEFATAVVASLPLPKFAYYGDLDHNLVLAYLSMLRLQGGRASRGARLWNAVQCIFMPWLAKRCHISLMRRYAHVWNVAANDAHAQAQWGIRASYINNIWPSAQRVNWVAERDQAEQVQPLKIIASVGSLDGTANTFGLLTLASEILPALKRRLGDGTFELHVYGGRSPRPFVVPYLDDPHIKLRGFVEDLDAEIISAPIFLVANNLTDFRVGHTRVLHAWSLGACVVGFIGFREAMPEMEHGVNVLLSESAVDLANHVAVAAGDRVLRRRLGATGLRTLQDKFSPSHVVSRIEQDMLTMVKSPAVGPSERCLF